MKLIKLIISSVALFVLMLSWPITDCFADPVFYATGDPVGRWFVSVNVDRSGNQGDSFSGAFHTQASDFHQAVNVTYDANRLDWIADIPSASHGGVGYWTFFVFRQTFDLTGFDPATAHLRFRWAADDSGEIQADRGAWIPKFNLNGGGFIYYPGSSPTQRIPTYGYSSWVDLSSGFVSGLNTIDFYVEGNGQTDGFGLQVDSFTAEQAVPVPASMLLLCSGLIGLAGFRKMTK